MTTIVNWLTRCAKARNDANEAIPVDALFRAMIKHDEWQLVKPADAAAKAYTSSGVSPAAAAGQRLTGLELAHALGGDSRNMCVHFAAGAPCLELTAEEVAHFCDFLRISVVESLLERLHDRAPMQTDRPCARLRDFNAFFCLCAGSGGART
jgi:hypothetical protein